MDRPSADEVAAAGAFVVPTLSVIEGLSDGRLRLPPGGIEKLAEVADGAAAAMQACIDAGVKLGFGTDLFGDLREQQSREFLVRGQIQSPVDVLRSATSINAELMNQGGELGCIKPGACADLIAFAGDPLNDGSVLAHPEKHLRFVMRGGVVVLDRLSVTQAVPA